MSIYYTQYHTAAEMVAMFDRVFGTRLTFVGFQRIAPRNWVRETKLGFKHFFYLHPIYHGSAYLPGGAISLDFVPRIKAGKVKLQPAAKHAEVHLAFSHEQALKDWNDWVIDRSRENAGVKLNDIAAKAVPAIVDWFETFESLEDVRKGFEAKRGLDRGGLVFPVTSRAYAFLLARMKRTQDARKEFARAMGEATLDKEIAVELTKFFDAELTCPVKPL